MVSAQKFLFFLSLISIFLRPFISHLAYPEADRWLSLWLLLGAVPFIVINKNRIRKARSDIFLFGWVCALIASFFTSRDFTESLSTLTLYLCPLGLFYFIRVCDDTQKKLTLKTFFFSSIALCLYGLYQYFFGFESVLNYLTNQSHKDSFAIEWLNRKRVFATFFSPNAFAEYLCIFMPVCFYLRRIASKEFTKALFFFALLLAGANLILTFSMGAITSLFISCLIIVLLTKNNDNKSIFVLLALCALFCFVLAWRFSSLKPLLNPALSVEDRLYYWKEALYMIAKDPWRAIGIGNFRGSKTLFVHNSYLQVWIETGFLGFITLSAFIVALLRAGFKTIKTHPSLACALLAFLIHNTVNFTFFLPESNWIWWLIAGLIVSEADKA